MNPARLKFLHKVEASLDELCDVRAVITTACRALEASNKSDSEVVVIKLAMKILDDAYDSTDLGTDQIRKRQKSSNRDDMHRS